MRALFIHADFIEYEARKKTKAAEEISDSQMSGRFEEVLVAFVSFEKQDEGKEKESAEALAANVTEIVGEVKAERVVLYPYAHLSSSLANAKSSVDILHYAEQLLREQGTEVHASPFGWYKSFNISCKGHPLSELSREIVAGEGEAGEEEVSEAVKAEETIKSDWIILDADGNEHKLDLDNGSVKGFDFNAHEQLKRFCQYEMAKSRENKGEPPHIDLMQRLELVDYEPGSDPGNFRYYPKGKMVKSLLERYVTAMVKKTGGMEIESPIMYDFEHPSLKEYMHRFPARQYTIQTPDKRVFLRFAACFGQFLMMHDATISYKNLPMRLYEMSRYSFRAEQRGELAGLRRLRSFTMPDSHSFAADMDMAKDEAVSRFGLTWDILSGIGFEIPGDLEFAIRATQEFYDNNKDFLVGLVKKWGKPALVEIWSDRFFYFVFKYEWNFVDVLDKASALNTDQIDVENAERYGITFVGKDGKRHHPLILHQSPSGAVERLIYALLERAHLRSQQGAKPKLPYWLSPTQVRLIPVTDAYNDDCVTLAGELLARADVDDRDMTVGKKIRDAEREWVDFIIVYGEKEKESGSFQVRIRGEDERAMTIKELEVLLIQRQGQMPFEPLPLPLRLSKRIIFRG
ncbi:MAG: threonine--tRNA ligase [Candidatus Proteinoplasmatales archaeon SG8-5]|nr:MAG: threonine--tRNA ligase [Candidatus Proteinoplasmatales archaeon SG8-5]